MQLVRFPDSGPIGKALASRLPRMLLLVAATPVLLASQAGAQGVGDLGVSPTRIVLEGRTRTAHVALLNKGPRSATYRISIVNMRMTDDGKFETIETPDNGQNFANRLLRFAPRRVVLAPGATQSVRILLRKPKDLAPGEYRSHLYFSAVPEPSAGRNVEMADDEGGIRISLTVVPGVTIPVIVRQGELKASASLSSLALTRSPGPGPDRPHISFRIDRTGDRSLFGDVTVTFRGAAGGDEIVLARANKLAVYTPNTERQLLLPLRAPDGVALTGGSLHVTYRARPEEGGEVLAEGYLDIP